MTKWTRSVRLIASAVTIAGGLSMLGPTQASAAQDPACTCEQANTQQAILDSMCYDQHYEYGTYCAVMQYCDVDPFGSVHSGGYCYEYSPEHVFCPQVIQEACT